MLTDGHSCDCGRPSVAVPVHAPGDLPGIREVLSSAAEVAVRRTDRWKNRPKVWPFTSATHEIAVRISPPDAAPVDLQVRERGGTVHVAVRTADGGLQTSLRQDLGALVDRLERSGFHAETSVTQELSTRMRLGRSAGV